MNHLRLACSNFSTRSCLLQPAPPTHLHPHPTISLSACPRQSHGRKSEGGSHASCQRRPVSRSLGFNQTRVMIESASFRVRPRPKRDRLRLSIGWEINKRESSRGSGGAGALINSTAQQFLFALVRVPATDPPRPPSEEPRLFEGLRLSSNNGRPNLTL